MDLRITQTVFLHVLGSIYEIGTGKSYTQRMVRRKIAKLLKAPQPSASECRRLNDQALRSI